MKHDLLLSLCLGLAALLHFVTAPERFTHAGIAIGILYLGLGVMQGVLAILLIRQPEHGWQRIARNFCTLLLALFLINQTTGSLILGIVPEPYSPTTVVRKLLEVFIMILSFSPKILASNKN